MFTAQLIGDRKDEQLRRRIVNIKFTSLEKEFDREFQFRIDEALEVIKRTVKSYLNELNLTRPVIDDLEPDAEVPPPSPTQAELDKIEWEADVARLKKIHTDILDLGVTPKQAMVTAIEALRTKIANNVKSEYLG